VDRKTEGVQLLVQAILRTRKEPYGEDIILEVFKDIVDYPNWQQRYKELSDELRLWVVNNWIGKYTKEITGLRAGKQVASTECDLIKSYTKLIR
jgi:hypothetical protein